MKTREKFQKILNFEPVPALPVVEWATWWDKTVDVWEGQGLAKCDHNVERMRLLGLELLVQEWFNPRAVTCPQPNHHGGAIINNLAEYRELKKNHKIFDMSQIKLENFARYNQEHNSGDAAFWFTLEGFFWFPRTLLGIEEHLYAFYDMPELIHEMNQDLVAFYRQVLDFVLSQYEVEFMTFAEDMSYNHGAMISEEQFNEFMLPYYQELIPILKKHNVKVFIDSDGDITECIKWFKRAGIEGILPLERQAGVDVAKIRAEHPNFLLLGAFDKTIMDKGEIALRKEFERLRPTAKQGGFIVSVDHQTPPNVSLNDYKLYLKLFKELL